MGGKNSKSDDEGDSKRETDRLKIVREGAHLLPTAERKLLRGGRSGRA